MMDENQEKGRQNIAPDIFSRGSLQLTYSLIRNRNPELALTVRNICGQVPLVKDATESGNKNSDFFRVELDSFQVRAIVELLGVAKESLAQSQDPGAMGQLVLAKTLLTDWLALAQMMIEELALQPNLQKVK